jgi:hypothetical protein
MKFPRKKHGSALEKALDVTVDVRDIGSRGSDRKVGMGPLNWSMDRRNRFPAIGSHIRGITYHTVRVHICIIRLDGKLIL